MKQRSAVSYWSSTPTNSWRKLWSLLAVLTLLMLTMAAEDTGVRPSLLLEQHAAHYNALGRRMICTCGCEQVLLECNHDRGSLGPCEVALRMRDELHVALQKGDTDDLILHAFAKKYGVDVLQPRNKKDLSSIAWIAWIAGFTILAGAGTILIVVRKKHRSAVVTPSPLSELSKVEADMLRRRVRAATENDDWG